MGAKDLSGTSEGLFRVPSGELRGQDRGEGEEQEQPDPHSYPALELESHDDVDRGCAQADDAADSGDPAPLPPAEEEEDRTRDHRDARQQRPEPAEVEDTVAFDPDEAAPRHAPAARQERPPGRVAADHELGAAHPGKEGRADYEETQRERGPRKPRSHSLASRLPDRRLVTSGAAALHDGRVRFQVLGDV